MTEKYCVPMYESERGWGSKIDSYAGPFDSLSDADTFQATYNAKYNNLDRAPDYYISALSPTPWTGQHCAYRGVVA